MAKWTWRIGVGVGILFAAPIVPLAYVVRAYLRKRRGAPPFSPTWVAFLGHLSRPGRAVFLSLAFVGAELVALELFSSQYFNAVDEHVPSVVGVFVLVILGLWAVVDVLLKQTVLLARNTVASLRQR